MKRSQSLLSPVDIEVGLSTFQPCNGLFPLLLDLESSCTVALAVALEEDVPSSLSDLGNIPNPLNMKHEGATFPNVFAAARASSLLLEQLERAFP